MAYMRGTWYIWCGGEEDKETININSEAMPMEIFDALVVMRYAELQEEKGIKKAESLAIKNYQGNFGCDALCRKYKKSDTMSMVKKLIKRKKAIKRRISTKENLKKLLDNQGGMNDR